MQKVQLSARGQASLVLGILLFFSIAITIAGYMASGQTREKIADFAADGATATGTITDKYIHVVRGTWIYWLDVSFKMQDGRTHNGSEEVPNTIYDGLNVGQAIQITYVRSTPEWFYVPGDAPTARDVAISEDMFQYGLIAGLLFLIALVVFAFWNRSEGTPAVRSPASDTAREFSFTPPRNRPRTGFGTRGH
ncbi:MAG TPA: DUF3592 domain-containing protein [Rhizomicrobium sp.]|nr:DUF3592 domain-containing protein [Rhizomicrobium sp.]